MFTYVDKYVHINANMPIDEKNAAIKVSISKFTHLHICVYIEANMCNVPVPIHEKNAAIKVSIN
jgi:hypothetical protein